MNWHRTIGMITGFYYFALGVFILYILISTQLGEFILRGNVATLASFPVGSTGYYFTTSEILMLVYLILIPVGIMLLWKLKRWAAIVGIIGTFMPAIITLIIEINIVVPGYFTTVYRIENIFFGWVFFVVVPALGVIFAWRELR